MPKNRFPFQMRTPEDLLGLVPYLLGYHPADSLVVLFVQADHEIRVAARHDLTTPATHVTDTIRAVAAREHSQSLIVVGYGPLSTSDAVAAIAADLTRHVPVAEAFLVTAGHYYCLGCPCGASGGVVFDPTATATAARAAFHGIVALPGRSDLLALAKPDPVEQAAVGGEIAAIRSGGYPEPAKLAFYMDLAGDGVRLTAAQVAELGVLLRDKRLRARAWKATSGRMWQRDLWLDMTRRMPDAYVTGPGSLAAWCAWMRGEEAIAHAAVRRVLMVNPVDRLTLLIAAALDAHIPGFTVGAWPPATTPTGGEQE
ncbi:DUF4192 domain-containing protein [Micromonospora sp. NPDC050397]|uniref:DUF4192 domain-containing protein n=1 Tax=Micromonospora sp. NPDC050397 TaxID=3364279 RepID=UPI0038513A5D